MGSNQEATKIIERVQQSELKFVNIGGFLMKFFTLPTDYQLRLAKNLLALSRNPMLNDFYVIKGFYVIETSKIEGRFNFMLEHSFRCSGCGIIADTNSNSFAGNIRSYCDDCEDKARESDQYIIANQLYD